MFQKVSINRMVIKMCCDNITVLIVCRMLYRREFFNFHAHWKDNDSTRMLAGRSPDTGTSLHNTVDLTITFVLSPFLIIILHITKCRLLRKCTNRSGLKGLPFAKDNLCISMCIRLILT